MNPVEENIDETLHDVCLGKDLLDMTSKAQAKEQKVTNGFAQNFQASVQQRKYQ
jgi:uncharacterized protein YejL (UPF0352 family)